MVQVCPLAAETSPKVFRHPTSWLVSIYNLHRQEVMGLPIVILSTRIFSYWCGYHFYERRSHIYWLKFYLNICQIKHVISWKSPCATKNNRKLEEHSVRIFTELCDKHNSTARTQRQETCWQFKPLPSYHRIVKKFCLIWKTFALWRKNPTWFC